MRENRSSGFLTRSNAKYPVQSQKKASSLKFRIQVEEQLYYLRSKARALQLLPSRSAPLFLHMQKVDFLMMRLIFVSGLGIVSCQASCQE